MKTLNVILFAFVLIACAYAQDSPGGHFYFSGPLNQLVNSGTKVAPVASGLPFSIVLTDSGVRISPADFDLKPAGGDLPIKLRFENLKFSGGRLTGTAKITNSSGSIIEGVRLDLVSTTEEFQTKDAKGNPVTSTRNQTANLASPLFFGDLAKGDSSDGVAFDVATIKFAPETTKVTVHGVVSGLRYLGAFNVPDVNDPKQIDIDAQGRIYICDTVGNRVLRTDAEGHNAETVAKLDDQCLSVAVNPKTGDIYAVRGNADVVYIFSNSGQPKGSFEGGDYVDLLHMRFDRAGNLHTSGSHVFRFQDQKPVMNIKEALNEELSAQGIDVDAGGNIWVVSGLEDKRSFFRLAPDGSSAIRISNGADWHLGALDVPETVRVDATGNAYVAELGQEGVEDARISVFDKNGQFVRAFGRGGRTPDSNADKLLPGQVYRPTDIAFGPDGRVYVSAENDGGFKENMMLMFKPF